MWYAVTANPLKLTNREQKKEFFSKEHEVILNAESREELEKKLLETKNQYPTEFRKYLRAVIKMVEAENIVQAKRLSKKISIYFDEKGQYHLL
jgi:16S rRNA C967 or C1407 C5-methylase (RsmB/RsmF family)